MERRVRGGVLLNTEIKNAVNAAGDMAQYDNRVKRILSEKHILAHILEKTVDEFKGMNPADIVTYIEGEPKIGIVPVEPGLTNKEKIDESGQRVKGLNSENVEANEGLIRFDIIFYVRLKSGLSQIIVNVEAQKDEPVSYKILNRAIFYVSRLISSQKERDFVNTNYDDIKQVFSIWVCMNMSNNSLSHFHLKKDEMLEPYDWKGNADLLNIVMIGVTNELPEHDEKYELHRLIGALLSDRLRENEKLDIIEKEYKIPLSNDFRKEVDTMCNLSQGIVDRVTAEVTAEVTAKNLIDFIMNMYNNKFSLEQISLATKKSVDEVKKIIEEQEAVLV